jgi:hypothetical protein
MTTKQRTKDEQGEIGKERGTRDGARGEEVAGDGGRVAGSGRGEKKKMEKSEDER